MITPYTEERTDFLVLQDEKAIGINESALCKLHFGGLGWQQNQPLLNACFCCTVITTKVILNVTGNEAKQQRQSNR